LEHNPSAKVRPLLCTKAIKGLSGWNYYDNARSRAMPMTDVNDVTEPNILTTVIANGRHISRA